MRLLTPDPMDTGMTTEAANAATVSAAERTPAAERGLRSACHRSRAAPGALPVVSPVAAGGEAELSMVLAHTGHWLNNLIYLAPVLLVVAALGVQRLRDRRAGITPRERDALDQDSLDDVLDGRR